MKPPPDQVAAIVDTSPKRSRTAMTLVPGAPGLPCVAYQEIMVWVASSGWKLPPLMPQSVWGAVALETSARTGLGEPWRSTTASWAVGWLEQWECRAAHAGTETGLGAGLGDGEGLGVSVGLGVGLGDGDGLCRIAEGLDAGASGPLAVHAATDARLKRITTPVLTAGWNEHRYGCVTRAPPWRKSPRIPPGRLALG